MLTLLLGVLSLCSAAPALALSQRGHEFKSAFSEQGSGDGQLAHPAGVAVSEATGDIYVVDAANNRIEQFNSEGGFIAAWGWGVSNGAKEYQVCTSACRAGLAGKGAGELEGAEAIAVDNSTNPSDTSKGDVYVETNTSEEHAAIEKFSPEGKPLLRIQGAKEKGSSLEKFEELDGLTVEANGELLVYDGGDVYRFGDGEKNAFVSELSSEAEHSPRPGIAAGPGGELYVAHEAAGGGEPPTVIAKLDGQGEALIQELDGEESSGVAVDNSTGAEDPFKGDVYVDHETEIAAFAPNGAALGDFGAGHMVAGAGVAADAHTGYVYVADSAADDIDVFEPEQAVHVPAIDELLAERTTATSTVLRAQIDPTGAETTYSFRYARGTVPVGDEECAEPACVELPRPKASLGEAFADQGASLQLQNLEPGTTYGYRVLAENANGEVESAEQTFTTQALVSGPPLPDGRVWEMVSPPAKNGAAIEALTREGGAIQASEHGGSITFVASAPFANPQGSRSPEVNQFISTRVGKSEWSTTDITTPNQQGEGVQVGAAPEYQLFSADLSVALVDPFASVPLTGEASEKTIYLRQDESCEATPATCYLPLVTAADDTAGTKFGTKLTFVGADSELSHVVLSSGVPLTSSPAASGENLYEWSGGALQLVNDFPLAPGETVAKPAKGARLGGNAGKANSPAVRHAVSEGGTRIFWTSGPDPVADHLFMRDTTAGEAGTGETVQIDVPEAGAHHGEHEDPRFQLASSEGSRVFFTDEQTLTTDSTAQSAKESADLYVCEVLENETTHKLEPCKLTDLTVDHNAGQTAEVLGVVPGASEDGSVVYFVANGVLAPGAKPGRCPRRSFEAVVGATCNLYVEQYDQEAGAWTPPTFIAALSAEDAPDWNPRPEEDLSRLTSRVSPNGNYLTFMSDQPLTGYDNRDINSGARDEEVYLYDLTTNRIVCASCNPTGARPNGIFDTEESGEGIGLLVDRPLTWLGRWLSGSLPGWTSEELERALYQSRYLSNSGRLFFNSAEALVPQDKNGKEDVYEYEPPGVGSCTTSDTTFSAQSGGCVALISSGTSAKESAFLDASANGDDVFFLTAAPLVTQDKDTSFDIYDASVCGQPGTEPCVSSPPTAAEQCNSVDSCRQAPESPPSFETPASVNLSGEGNILAQQQVAAAKVTVKPKPLTRAQELAAALKACKKDKRKSKRLACEAQAKKRYGSAKSVKKADKAKQSSARGSGR